MKRWWGVILALFLPLLCLPALGQEVSSTLTRSQSDASVLLFSFPALVIPHPPAVPLFNPDPALLSCYRAWGEYDRALAEYMTAIEDKEVLEDSMTAAKEDDDRGSLVAKTYGMLREDYLKGSQPYFGPGLTAEQHSGLANAWQEENDRAAWQEAYQRSAQAPYGWKDEWDETLADASKEMADAFKEATRKTMTYGLPPQPPTPPVCDRPLSNPSSTVSGPSDAGNVDLDGSESGETFSPSARNIAVTLDLSGTSR